VDKRGERDHVTDSSKNAAVPIIFASSPNSRHIFNRKDCCKNYFYSEKQSCKIAIQDSLALNDCRQRRKTYENGHNAIYGGQSRAVPCPRFKKSIKLFPKSTHQKCLPQK